jgi:hypothetical protein
MKKAELDNNGRAEQFSMTSTVLIQKSSPKLGSSGVLDLEAANENSQH